MKRTLLLVGLISFGLAGLAQDQAPATGQKVELKGTIEKVSAERGKGMPSIEVREGGRTVKVILGSIRYLMEQNFNPKAGEEVEVKGFRVSTGNEVLASTVKLGADGKVLRLRDENGRPVWMGGMGRGGMRMRGGRGPQI